MSALGHFGPYQSKPAPRLHPVPPAPRMPYHRDDAACIKHDRDASLPEPPLTWIQCALCVLAFDVSFGIPIAILWAQSSHPKNPFIP